LGALILTTAGTEICLAEDTYRLYQGVTIYVNNPQGQDFSVNLDVRDLNLFANGPREVLFKVYDPDGQPVVREVIPDDGVTSGNFPERIGGWDHELQYYADLYARGTRPSFQWSAWSDPNRLQSVVSRSFNRKIKGSQEGIYRIVLAGTRDHYVTLKLTPDLKFGVAGHHTWMHGHGNLLSKSYIYIPKGTDGIFFAVAEPDEPRTRHFKLTAPDGKVLLSGPADGGYASPGSGAWKDASLAFAKPGQYDGKLLVLEVSEGQGDYLVKVTLQQPKTGAFADYVGMGSQAVFAPDRRAALAIKGGTTVVDGLVFWHPFQIRFYRWLKAHPLTADDKEKALRKELEALFNYFRLLETSDGRGSRTWTNWAYALGYYGCKIWRPGWTLLRRNDVSADLKAIIREGLIMAGDRLSFAVGIECVNGNAFSQIPVALWYGHRATGDPMLKERFELFWDRWKTEGWGPGCGLSRSGDSQEHFAHDMHYGSYLMDNWRGLTWVAGSILDDATDDPRFKEVIGRYRDLYSYLHCQDASGRTVHANPWSSRTRHGVGSGTRDWKMDGRTWKGAPGPEFTVSVNGGDEWFAARRRSYYMLTFHGRLAPAWLSHAFGGQLGFGGGAICQLTVPGKGPVLVSTLNGAYGEGMHPSQWHHFRLHSVVGESWDGRPLVTAISEHADASLKGKVVSSSGEVRGSHVKISRNYTYNRDSIDCEVGLAESDYAAPLSIWSRSLRKNWSEVRTAYEMLPYMADNAPTAVTLRDDKGKDLGAATPEAREAKDIRIDRGGYGVDVRLEKPMKVKLGANSTVLIQLTPEGKSETPAGDVALKYRLVPFGN